MNSPYHKQFVHSKSQQYRKLKNEWRNHVFLGRSRIQVCKHMIGNYMCLNYYVTNPDSSELYLNMPVDSLLKLVQWIKSQAECLIMIL